MQYTSAEANKLIKNLIEEEQKILVLESHNSKFQAAVGENIEDVRPDYDLLKTKIALDEVQTKIRKIKHAINIFNTRAEVIDGMTVDEVLIRLPQLNARKQVLRAMMTVPAKARAKVYGNGAANVIDYTYANYDPKDAELSYKAVCEQIDKLQLALDQVNNTKKIEIDL